MRHLCRVLAALGLVIPAALAAQTAPRWQWTASATVFAPQPSGTISVTGIGGPDMLGGAGDLAIDVQARRGDWAFLLDGSYLGLEEPPRDNSNNPGGGSVDSGGAQSRQRSLQGLALRRVGSSVEIAFGAVVNHVSENLAVYGKFLGNPFAVTQNSAADWALPLVGVRYTPVDSDRWHLVFFGEGGYLGSDNTMYQVVPAVGYRIGPTVEIAAQVRVMGTTYRAPSSPSDFAYSVRTTALGGGVGLRF